MPLLERVREIGADEAALTEENVGAARIALAREMARSPKPERVRWRPGQAWAGVGIGGLVAGAAVTAIVVGSVLAPPTTPSASAAEVLNAAAEAASDPQLAAGQYLAVSSNFQYMQRWDVETHAPAADSAHADGSFLVDQPLVRYKPADSENADWIVERRPDAVVETWGDQTAVEQWQELWQGVVVSDVTRYPGGVGHVERDGVSGEAYFIDGREFYEGMPDDPEGIIDWWNTRYADEQDDGGYAHFFVETVTDTGTFNLAPASIRAAMLGAFASVEGMEVVRTEGHLTTMRFDRGSKDRPSVLEFVLDTEHGYIVSVTDWGDASATETASGMPAWNSRSVSTVEVVDSAP